MAKLRLPFFSFAARGSLNRILSARHRDRGSIMEKRPYPRDAKTSNQLAWRTMYQACTDLWNSLSLSERKVWHTNARPLHQTGYSLYMSQCLRPNPGIYLPLAGGTMSGDIDMASRKILTLPTPALGHEAANKDYVDAAAPAPDFPRPLKVNVTRYVIPGWFVDGLSNIQAASDRIYYIPIFVCQTTTYDRIGIYVSGAAVGTADLRLFTWAAGLPDALILSAGTVNTGTSGAKEIVISQQLTRGYYFLAIRCTAGPNLYGPSLSNAVAPPVPGISITAFNKPDRTIPYVNTTFADPAPAPTGVLGSEYAYVFLREA